MRIARSGARKFSGWKILAAGNIVPHWDAEASCLELIVQDAGSSSGSKYHVKAVLSPEDIAVLLTSLSQEGLASKEVTLKRALADCSRHLLRLLLASSEFPRVPPTDG